MALKLGKKKKKLKKWGAENPQANFSNENSCIISWCRAEANTDLSTLKPVVQGLCLNERNIFTGEVTQWVPAVKALVFKNQF